MKSQMKELKEWLEQKQMEIHNEEMSETQNTIFATLQLVKRQVEYITEKNNSKNKNSGSPGHYGC